MSKITPTLVYLSSIPTSIRLPWNHVFKTNQLTIPAPKHHPMIQTFAGKALRRDRCCDRVDCDATCLNPPVASEKKKNVWHHNTITFVIVMLVSFHHLNVYHVKKKLLPEYRKYGVNIDPRKLTCPVKINGWKLEDVFPIEIVPFWGTCWFSGV